MPYLCKCNRPFKSSASFTKHKRQCPVVQSFARNTSNNAKHALEDGTSSGYQPNKRARSHLETMSFDGVLHEASSTAGDIDVPEVRQPSPPSVFTRVGRRVRATWKVLDQLPEAAGAANDDDIEPIVSPSHVPRVRLLVTERIKSAANRFGITRLYKRRPVRSPETTLDVETVYTPTAAQHTASRTKRAIAAIVAPFPNLSSFLYGQHFWLHGNKKSVDDSVVLQKIITGPNFSTADLAQATLDTINAQLASDDVNAPWTHEGDGWLRTPISIGLPSGQKLTKAHRQAAAEALRKMNRTERLPDRQPDKPLDGETFYIGDFYHKDLIAEIKHTFETDPAAKDFVFDPHLLYHSPPGTSRPPEPVYGELYNSPAVVEADVQLQNSPPEPGCTLPRAIAMLMGYSDATLVTQFGQNKVWPYYQFYGNQSKYARVRPTSHAAHHAAYFPTLPDSLQTEVRERLGKAGSDAFITHARRELFHAAWNILLDDKFVEAYKHGIVVDCIDGVRRRLYPRLFTYSADYPEKMLVTALRDKGQHPCPHCLITFDDIPQIGTKDDAQRRNDLRRVDDQSRRQRVQDARRLIYEDGYAVNSVKVNDLLKDLSLTPTENAFSNRLGTMGLDPYRMLTSDVLHEFEIGGWKAIVTHLIRILEAIHPDKVHELNARFRQVPIFGENTIRRFTRNVSDMTRIAARDFEDMLQCAIPCFEGLLPSPDNEHVMSLLWLLAYWHGLVKMRLHVESSVQLADQTFSALGTQLRHFEQVVCPRYPTRETQREHAARLRAKARTSHTVGRPSADGQTPAQPSITPSRQPRSFHLRTIKFHLLGDTTYYIRTFGTTDSYSTMAGEHEHSALKHRNARTNGRNIEPQIAKIDTRERRLRRMAFELEEHGIAIPGIKPSHSRERLATVGPERHHWIAQESDSRIALYLQDWQYDHPNDPAVQGFTFLLREHVRLRLWGESDHSPKDPFAVSNSIVLRHECIYRHALARINFTSYDVQREQDVIHCTQDSTTFPLDKSAVLVFNPARHELAPWEYAVVLGVFHAFVVMPGTADSRRVDFLWVRWLERDQSWLHGPSVRRLERLQLADLDTDGAVGFIDPAAVIRGCHLVPAFNYGRLAPAGYPSVASSSLGDWRYFYVMRFSDRDLLARHTGMSVGSLELQAFERETIMDDARLQEEIATAAASKQSTSADGDNVLGAIVDSMSDKSLAEADAVDDAVDDDFEVAASDAGSMDIVDLYDDIA